MNNIAATVTPTKSNVENKPSGSVSLGNRNLITAPERGEDRSTSLLTRLSERMDRLRKGDRESYLRLGDVGEDVATLKEMLNSYRKQAGQPLLKIDYKNLQNESFDRELDLALREFQKSVGLVDDGIFGFRTFSKSNQNILDILKSKNDEESKKLYGHRLGWQISSIEYEQLEERDRKALGSVLGTSVSNSEPLGDGASYISDNEILQKRTSLTSYFGRGANIIKSPVGYILSGAEGTTNLRGVPKYEKHTDPGNNETNWGIWSVNSAYFRNITSAEQANSLYWRKLQTEATAIAPVMRQAGLDPENWLVMSSYLSLWLQSPRAARQGMVPLFKNIAEQGSSPEALLSALHNAADKEIAKGQWWASKTIHIKDQNRRFAAIQERIKNINNGTFTVDTN
jgi:Putative peptidoglycan binding domain